MTTKSSDIDRQYLQVCRDIGEAQYTKELIVTFLKVWRKHANGVHGITVPETTFTVEFTTPAAYGVLSVVIVETPFELHPNETYKLSSFDDNGRDPSLRRPWVTSHCFTEPVKTPQSVVHNIISKYDRIHIPLGLLYSSHISHTVKAIVEEVTAGTQPTLEQLQLQLISIQKQLNAFRATFIWHQS